MGRDKEWLFIRIGPNTNAENILTLGPSPLMGEGGVRVSEALATLIPPHPGPLPRGEREMNLNQSI